MGAEADKEGAACRRPVSGIRYKNRGANIITVLEFKQKMSNAKVYFTSTFDIQDSLFHIF
jgi:hypothetical protein